jgi:hypothetical protein
MARPHGGGTAAIEAQLFLNNKTAIELLVVNIDIVYFQCSILCYETSMTRSGSAYSVMDSSNIQRHNAKR